MNLRYFVVAMMVFAVLRAHETYAAVIRCRVYKEQQDASALSDFCKRTDGEVMIGDSPQLKSEGIEPYRLGTEQWIFLAFRNSQLVGLLNIRNEEGHEPYNNKPIKIRHLIAAHEAPLGTASALLRSAALYLSAENFSVRVTDRMVYFAT